MGDPNPLVSGRGIELLRSQGVEVAVGILEVTARRQNAPFLTRIGRGRPHVTMALSADGRWRSPGPLHASDGDVANRRIHRDRAEVDAIAIGSGTLLNDDPLLTARIAYRRRPFVRVIFDRRRRTPPAARVLSTLESGPVIIVTGNADASSSQEPLIALTRAGASVEAISPDSETFEDAALRRLAQLGVSSVTLEGGPTTQRAFWDRGLVDRVQMYVVPRPIGPNGLGWWATVDQVVAELEDVRWTRLGADMLIEGDVHRID
jgi:diaminohydroxyphosphoribosylaminopyrimidine deaminase/5-amino-6-(5-phosphoribosylamino)uracil reductase